MRVRNKCILTTVFTDQTLVLIACAVLFSVAPAAPVLAAGAVPPAPAPAPTPIAPKDATTITAQINAALLEELPFADQQDFEDAQRGFIATLPEVQSRRRTGIQSGPSRGTSSWIRRSRPHHQPQPLAHGAAEHEQWPVRGHGPHLPGARL